VRTVDQWRYGVVDVLQLLKMLSEIKIELVDVQLPELVP